jgi:hypothetical protein
MPLTKTKETIACSYRDSQTIFVKLVDGLILKEKQWSKLKLTNLIIMHKLKIENPKKKLTTKLDYLNHKVLCQGHQIPIQYLTSQLLKIKEPLSVLAIHL